MGILAAIGGWLIAHAGQIIGAAVVASTVYGVVSTEQAKAENKRIEQKNDAIYAEQQQQNAAMMSKNSAEIDEMLSGNISSNNETNKSVRAAYLANARMRENRIYSYGTTHR